MNRLPRKIKKGLKKKYKHRYGCEWLKCDNLIIEYIWFFKNPLKYDMDKQIYKNNYVS